MLKWKVYAHSNYAQCVLSHFQYSFKFENGRWYPRFVEESALDVCLGENHKVLVTTVKTSMSYHACYFHPRVGHFSKMNPLWTLLNRAISVPLCSCQYVAVRWGEDRKGDFDKHRLLDVETATNLQKNIGYQPTIKPSLNTNLQRSIVYNLHESLEYQPTKKHCVQPTWKPWVPTCKESLCTTYMKALSTNLQ